MDGSKSILKSRNIQTSRLEDSITNKSSRSRYEESDSYRGRSYSKDSLVKLKQVFKEMDFRSVERLARSKSIRR
jgi:hypothetical protein